MSTSPSCPYGACLPPNLDPLEDDPLIVTVDVTSTSVILTNAVNTLTVAGPMFTETTTIMVRSTFTSTEVALSTLTTTTTYTSVLVETSFLTRPLIDEEIAYSYITGITTVGPFIDVTTRISTVIFTSYELTTQTRNFTSVSKTTKTSTTTSAVFIYVRTTDLEVSYISVLYSERRAITTSYIRVTVPVTTTSWGTNTTSTTLLTISQTDFSTTAFDLFTVLFQMLFK